MKIIKRHRTLALLAAAAVAISAMGLPALAAGEIFPGGIKSYSAVSLTDNDITDNNSQEDENNSSQSDSSESGDDSSEDENNSSQSDSSESGDDSSEDENDSSQSDSSESGDDSSEDENDSSQSDSSESSDDSSEDENDSSQSDSSESGDDSSEDENNSSQSDSSESSDDSSEDENDSSQSDSSESGDDSSEDENDTSSVSDDEKLQIELEDVTAEAGDTVEVNVNLKNNPGVVSFRVLIGYDREAMQLESVSYETIEGSKVESGSLSAYPFRLFWGADLKENSTYTGTAAVLTFKLNEDAAPGSYEISLTSADDDDFFDCGQENVPYLLTGGAITVKEPAEENNLTGTVTLINDEDYSSILITAVDTNGQSFTIEPEEDGSFAARLPEGGYTVTFKKLNYAPKRLTVTVGSEPVSVNTAVYHYGDLNRDGKVNMRDYVSMQRLLLTDKILDLEYDTVDFNNSGTINMVDYVFMQRILIGGKYPD